jgi:NAD-dependent dihydropyrimidine dehydrogenase PreA subunit|tara:strand:- start:25057 stop:25455 length:399 start_codon:yes stop_codon:yes gene_type:complete
MMANFFVSEKDYKTRLSICKECIYYFAPTGQCKQCLCFMKLKAKLALLECPKKFWLKTKAIVVEDVPQDIVEECLLNWEDIKTGTAKNIEAKRKMIELHNIVYGTNFDRDTNCGSCLQSCLDGMRKIKEKYK